MKQEGQEPRREGRRVVRGPGSRWRPFPALCRLGAGLATLLTSVAGTITLEIQTDVNKQGQAVELVLRIANKGDDIARRVKPQAWIQKENFDFPAQDLAAGALRTFRARRTLASLAALKPGEYPVCVHVAYTDSDGTQHNAPAYGILRTADGRYPPLPVKVDVTPLDLGATEQKWVVSVKNTLASPLAPLRLAASLHTSPRLRIIPPAQTFDLPAYTTTNLAFAIQNAGDPLGSVKPLFVFLEHDAARFHVTKVVETQVIISDDGAMGREPAAAPRDTRPLRTALALSAVVLAAGGLATWWLGGRRGR